MSTSADALLASYRHLAQTCANHLLKPPVKIVLDQRSFFMLLEALRAKQTGSRVSVYFDGNITIEFECAAA